MKKTLIFLIIALTLGVTSCEKNQKTPTFDELTTGEENYEVEQITNISIELEKQIINSYQETFVTNKNYQLVIDDCYLFNDGLCFFFAHGLYNTYLYCVSEEISGYKFIYPNSNNLLVLYNDRVLSMTEAFENGIVNEDRTSIFFQLYKVKYANLYDSNILTLDYNLLIKIKDDYAVKYNVKDFGDITISNYFGKYNDATVLIIYNGGYYQTTSIEIIDGIEFKYSNSNKINVYIKNQFYDLKTAFEMNLLTRENLIEISEKLNKK